MIWQLINGTLSSLKRETNDVGRHAPEMNIIVDAIRIGSLQGNRMIKSTFNKLSKAPVRLACAGIAAITLTLCVNPQIVWACGEVASNQDKKETSSRRDAGAVDSIEKAGGKVYKISAADESREVSFYLSSKPIKDEHVAAVPAVRDVIWVNLAGTEITNDGLKHLKGLSLKKLHLERTKIGDAGLVHLKECKDLEYLNLYGSKVTDAGLEHLTGLKNLKKLFVWQTGVTEAGMQKLNESLPNLKIIGEIKLVPVVIEESAEKKEEAKKEEAKKEEAKKEEAKKEEAKKEEAEKGRSEKGRSEKGRS